jgi:hypothetical protein
MNDILKTTPLHAWHLAQGAKMAPFGGYEMPLWYASAKREHLAVLVAVGLFDTSHMAVLIEEQGRYFTHPYLGEDLRKLAEMETAEVLDHRGVCMGKVLTCVTDVAIDRREDAVYSIASPRKPADFSPRGLCCGFVRVTRSLGIGERVVLKDSLREIPITISADIRPDRTARRPIAEMI